MRVAPAAAPLLCSHLCVERIGRRRRLGRVQREVAQQRRDVGPVRLDGESRAAGGANRRAAAWRVPRASVSPPTGLTGPATRWRRRGRKQSTPGQGAAGGEVCKGALAARSMVWLSNGTRACLPFPYRTVSKVVREMTVKSPNSSPPSSGGPSSKKPDVSLKKGAEAAVMAHYRGGCGGHSGGSRASSQSSAHRGSRR